MMHTLIITSRPLTTLTSGYDLRVINLCRELGGEQHLFVIPMLSDSGVATDISIDARAHFASVEMLPAPSNPVPVRRALLWSESDMLAHQYPTYFATAVARVQQRIRETGAERVVVFSQHLTGLAARLGVQDLIIDLCDSRSLTLSRAASSSTSVREQLARRLRVWRAQRAEADAVRAARLVTTINEADSNAVRRSAARGGAHVCTVPNGVDTTSMPRAETSTTGGCISFWGNLRFEPNRDAMHYFTEAVYLPYLEPAGVGLRIIGEGADDTLQRVAAQHPGVQLMGYVENLADALRGCALMVNPMVSGSGLKNKVLESFVRRLPVVTTPLGVEAIPEVQHGQHVVVASAARDLATVIRDLLSRPWQRDALADAAYALATGRYSWASVGARWRQAIESADGPARRGEHPTQRMGAVQVSPASH